MNVSRVDNFVSWIKTGYYEVLVHFWWDKKSIYFGFESGHNLFLKTLEPLDSIHFCDDCYGTANGLLTVCVRWSRLRVKDINDAIKELGQMISAHTGSSQPMTRLMIVQEAVTVITALEQQLRGTVWPDHPHADSNGVALCMGKSWNKTMQNACGPLLLSHLLHVHGQLLNAKTIESSACECHEWQD